MMGGNNPPLLSANLIQVYLILFGVRVKLLNLKSLLKLKVTILGVTILFNHHRASQGLPFGGRLHTVPLVYRQGFHPKVTSIHK